MNLTKEKSEPLPSIDDDEIEVRLTKLEELLEELRKSNEEKEAV